MFDLSPSGLRLWGTPIVNQRLAFSMISFSEIRHLQTDMLIIGSGVAGMLAVVGAMRSGVRPMIATKSNYASGSSSIARGGHSLGTGHSDPADNTEIFSKIFRTAARGSATSA